MQPLVSEDLVCDSCEQKCACQSDQEQIEHFSCPNWVVVIERLVVTVAHSCDRRCD